MRLIITTLCLFAASISAFADAANDWKALVALDAGPSRQPKDGEEAQQMALAHMDRQEKALRDFMTEHPKDTNAWETKLRLVRVLHLRANLTQKEAPAEAARLMTELEKTASPEKLSDVEFTRLTLLMRRWQGKRVPVSERDALHQAALQFQERFPADRRVAPLLVEISRLFEGKPEIKTKLLQDASAKNSDPNLKIEIADEFKRLACLDKPLSLKLRDVDGSLIKTEEWRGTPVLLIFISVRESACLTTMGDISKAISKLSEKPRLVLLSLDEKKEDVITFIERYKIKTLVAWEKQGWDSPAIRGVGINLIPSVWLLDGEGIVRSLDPMDNLAASIKSLKK